MIAWCCDYVSADQFSSTDTIFEEKIKGMGCTCLGGADDCQLLRKNKTVTAKPDTVERY